MTTTTELNSLIDHAPRQQLLRYDDGRMWFLVKDAEIDLATAAWCGLQDPQQLLEWVEAGRVLLSKSIHQLPGEDFYCIYFEDAYFLAPYGYAS
jgi:hypothetical protein